VTGSKQGITNPPGNPAYNASKSAVQTITEHLSFDLAKSSPKTSVHLLVPGWTFTGLTAGGAKEKPAGAWAPEQVADYLYKKMGEGKFYAICPDNDVQFEEDRKRMMWTMVSRSVALQGLKHNSPGAVWRNLKMFGRHLLTRLSIILGRCGIRAHAAESMEGRVQGGGGQDHGADEAGDEAGRVSIGVYLGAGLTLHATTIDGAMISQTTCRRLIVAKLPSGQNINQKASNACLRPKTDPAGLRFRSHGV